MITVDCRNAGLRPSGIVEYQRSLANHLPAVAPGFQFRMVVPMGTRTRFATHPNAHELAVRDEPIPSLHLRTDNTVERQAITLFHDTTGTHGFATDVPVVSTIHDADRLTENAPASWRLAESVRAHLLRRAMLSAARRSVRIIVPSEAARRKIAESIPSLERKLRVVPNGVAPEFTGAEATGSRQVELAKLTVHRLLPNVSSYVLCVGGRSPHRNHEGLVRAFARAFRRDPELHLVFVRAEGAEPPSAGRVVEQVGLHDRVHPLQGLARSELIALYQRAECLCHPSLWDSYPTPVVEAMACGCPVVTSDRGALKEIAVGAAQLVNPERDDDIERGLLRVVRKPEVARALRAKGLARARTLSADRTALRTWEVYDEALTERAHTG